MKSSGMAKAIALLLASAAGSVKAESRPPKDPNPVDVAQFGMASEERYVFCHGDCPRHSVKHKRLVEVAALPAPVDEIPVKAPIATSPTFTPTQTATADSIPVTPPHKPAVKRRNKRKIHCPIPH